jgi:glycosyltransferase 2 family protein
VFAFGNGEAHAQRQSVSPREEETPAVRHHDALRHERGNIRRWLVRFLAAAALALAAFLLYRTLSRYDLDQIVASVVSIPLDRLALAGAFAAASYLCLTGFDALAVRYVGRVLPYRSVALASFCSLSIGHNVGLAALSSGAIRYRFYSRWGMSAEQVAKLILFCAITASA